VGAASAAAIAKLDVLLFVPLLALLVASVGVDRQGLSAFLVDEAAARFPDSITFHWHAAAATLDLQARTVTWQEELQAQPDAAPLM
jgi:hypothetical protein